MSQNIPSANTTSPYAGGSKPYISPINETINPSENFYAYINNHWQKHVILPPYNGSYGISEEVEDEVRDTLLNMIEKQRSINPSHPISKFATSFLEPSYQQNSILALKKIFQQIHSMKTNEDIGSMIGKLNRMQSRSPIALVVSGDSYKTSECCIFLYEAELGLPSKRYYQSHLDRSTKQIFNHYTKVLKKLSIDFDIPNLDDSIRIEKKILPCLSTYDERENIHFTYNPYSFSNLQKEYTNVPWDSMLKGWGIQKSLYKKARFVLTNKRYVHCLENMFRELSMDDWQTWMTAMTILSFIEYLPPPFDDYHFELFGKDLKGIKQKLPTNILTLKALKRFIPMDLSEMFVNVSVPSGTKKHAIELVTNLKMATIHRIQRLSWMTEPTKEKAIKKIKSMKFQVAYPETWVSETKNVEILKDQPLQNILNLNANDTDRMITQLRTNDCAHTEEKWDDGPFEVNAYYYSEGNMMVVPAGILRFPFFDLTRSKAWNYGAIGSAIGHEITHGFDIDGRMYDAEGNYKNWWTEEDSTNYKELTKKIVKLFDGTSYMGGEVDGELTLSENLSDLGGMAIALEALNSTLGTDLEERKEAYRDFFISYAISWRNKDRPKKAKQSLYTNSHAPAHLRVNLIVKQFEEFYIAFDIQPHHTGFVSKKSRIALW